MANFVLDKGYIVDGTAAAVAYRFVNLGSDDVHIDLTPAAGGPAIGVIMENIDAAKVTTGKATANVRVMGIAPVTAAEEIALTDLVTTDIAGKAVVAGTGDVVLGKPLQAAAADGDIINVGLVPFGAGYLSA